MSKYSAEDGDDSGYFANQTMGELRLAYAKIDKNEAAFERIRSLLRGLPRSATAESIDRVCAEALGVAEQDWPAEHGQFGVGA